MPSFLRRPLPSRSLITLTLTLGLPAFVYTDTHILTKAPCTGTSMSPTLSPFYRPLSSSSSSSSSPADTLSEQAQRTGSRDHILLNRRTSCQSSLRRGEIVAFWTPEDPERWAIKRVVALGGDTVVLDERRRWVRAGNGDGKRNRSGKVKGQDGEEKKMWKVASAQDSDGVGGAREKETGRVMKGKSEKPRVDIPWGHIWVEGDNWRESKDSNDYGPISTGLLVGKATHIVWPPSRLGRIPWEEYKIKTRVIPRQDDTPPEEWAVHV